MKLVIDSRDLDRIIRDSMHALNMAKPHIKKYPDIHVDHTLQEIREHSLSITKFKEFEKIQRKLRRTVAAWKTLVKHQPISHEEKLSECARNLVKMRNGDMLENGMGVGVIIKRNGEYSVDNKIFKNAWKAAKYLCKNDKNKKHKPVPFIRPGEIYIQELAMVERVKRCFRKLEQMRDGEESVTGLEIIILKKDGQYFIDGVKYKTALEAAKCLAGR